MSDRSVLDWPYGVSIHNAARCYNGYTLVHGRGIWDPTRAKPIDKRIPVLYRKRSLQGDSSFASSVPSQTRWKGNTEVFEYLDEVPAIT